MVAQLGRYWIGRLRVCVHVCGHFSDGKGKKEGSVRSLFVPIEPILSCSLIFIKKRQDISRLSPNPFLLTNSQDFQTKQAAIESQQSNKSVTASSHDCSGPCISIWLFGNHTNIGTWKGLVSRPVPPVSTFLKVPCILQCI